MSCENEEAAVENAEAAAAAEMKCFEADPQSPEQSSCQAELMAA
jgi:hypothetical protein